MREKGERRPLQLHGGAGEWRWARRSARTTEGVVNVEATRRQSGGGDAGHREQWRRWTEVGRAPGAVRVQLQQYTEQQWTERSAESTGHWRRPLPLTAPVCSRHEAESADRPTRFSGQRPVSSSTTGGTDRCCHSARVRRLMRCKLYAPLGIQLTRTRTYVLYLSLTPNHPNLRRTNCTLHGLGALPRCPCRGTSSTARSTAQRRV